MERARKDKVVVGADLVKATFVEGPVVNQAARLVDYDESENSPSECYLISSMAPD